MIAEGLVVDPTNQEVMRKLRAIQGYHRYVNSQHHDAIKAISEALLLDDRNVTLFMLRAKCYIALAFFDDAMIDLLEAERLNEVRNAVWLEIEALRRKIGQVYLPQTNYDFLEVSRAASESEIQLSFKNLTLLHSVNIAKATTAAEKRKLEFKYKRVENAFVILTTPALRERYLAQLAKQEATIDCPSVDRCCQGVSNCYHGCCGGIGSCCGNCCAGVGRCFGASCDGVGGCCRGCCSGLGACCGGFERCCGDCCNGCGKCCVGCCKCYSGCCSALCSGFGDCLRGLGGCLNSIFCSEGSLAFFAGLVAVSLVSAVVIFVGYWLWTFLAWIGQIF